MRIAGKIVVSVLSVITFAGTAYGYSTLTSLDEVSRSDVLGGGEPAKPGERPADGSLDILLVGRDSRDDTQGNPLPRNVLQELRAGANGDDLTDTLIVLRIPNGQESIKAFSIPRDSYVRLAGGPDKINSAFGKAKAAEASRLRAAGETDKDRLRVESLTAGRRATRQAVEDLTGVTIDHFAEVNLLSFYDISNAVGGVPVCLKEATKDEDSGADFPKGPQKVSGGDALAFVRQRKNLPRSDLDRVVRQQVFLASLAHEVLSAGTLADPGKLGALIDAVKKSVVIDSTWNLLDFVGRLQGITGGGIQFSTIPVANPDYRYSRQHPSWTAVQVDPVQVKAFAAGLIGAPPSGAPPSGPAAGPIVDVSNAGEASGLAARVADVLEERGFTPGRTGNTTARRASLVRYGPGLAAPGAQVADLLGGLATTESADVPAGHIEVLLGQVYSGPGASAGGGGGAAAGPRDDAPITSAGENCVD
ncbi:LCP family protein [Amycolatopsis sp. PS_44_ISF1]|uniref:LCP family protein n=1 Tax=Amycolatopsis sp. PS_44_ISF1 TaxID=2974917 RepID=UPI0028DEFC72|nr:LCP family protein [Amycolatopsis sp. PS_44_ISF1]MDT8914545.1 LCP family protein [Amycolatopsis sp. PS_44_ISF1]